MIRDNKFSVTQIKNKTVGEILAETRKELNISLEEAAQETRIHQNYLAALEAEEYFRLPGGVYSEKILQTYADFLNIDFDCLKKTFTKEIQISQHPSLKTFVPKISRRNFVVTPRLLKISTGVVAIILLLTYLSFEINNIFAPPPLEIFSPVDNLVTAESNIEISGQTGGEVRIRINDQEIQGNKNGYFEELISLKEGLNVIKISAAKKRGKENVIYRQVVLTK